MKSLAVACGVRRNQHHPVSKRKQALLAEIAAVEKRREDKTLFKMLRTNTREASVPASVEGKLVRPLDEATACPGRSSKWARNRRQTLRRKNACPKKKAEVNRRKYLNRKMSRNTREAHWLQEAAKKAKAEAKAKVNRRKHLKRKMSRKQYCDSCSCSLPRKPLAALTCCPDTCLSK